jgi:hypothetical protein
MNDGFPAVRRAWDDATVLAAVDERISAGFYRDRLFIAFALPKCGSGLIHNILRILQQKDDSIFGGRTVRPEPDPWLPMDRTHVAVYANGGVIKNHSYCSAQTLALLQEVGAKHLIGIRHPLDLIVALFHHFRRVNSAGDPRRHTFWNLTDHTVRYDLDWNTTDDTIIDKMLDLGVIEQSITWTAHWLKRRDVTRSVVLRYEDIVSQMSLALEPVSRLMNNRPLSEEEAAFIDSFIVNSRRRHSEEQKCIYRKGWTGDVNLAKKYFYGPIIEKASNIINKLYSEKSYEEYFAFYPDLIDLSPESLPIIWGKTAEKRRRLGE